MPTHSDFAIDRIVGTAVPLRGHDIDTDRIMPARFLRAVHFEGLEEHVFEDDRLALEQQGQVHPFSNPAYAGACVLLVNDHFGSGSSREHAPQGLRRWGIQAIVGASFSEIFFGNSVKLGIACLTAASDDVEHLMSTVEATPKSRLEVSVRDLRVAIGDRRVTVSMPAVAQGVLLAGTWDATSLLLADFHEVEAVAARLPYVGAFVDTAPR